MCVYICRYCKTYNLKRNLNKHKQYIWQMSDAEAKQVGALIAFRNGMLCGGYSTQHCVFPIVGWENWAIFSRYNTTGSCRYKWNVAYGATNTLDWHFSLTRSSWLHIWICFRSVCILYEYVNAQDVLWRECFVW